MRIVIDLQGTQTASRTRGIGRYSMAFTAALIRHRGDHEVILALNGLFPETIQPIRDAFGGMLPRDHILVWEAPGPIAAGSSANEARRRRAELIYEAFLAGLAPDIVHVSSLFEGLVDDAATSIGTLGKTHATSVQLYDLIPLHDPEAFLAPDPVAERHYRRKLADAARADLILAISDFTARDARERLRLDAASVVGVSAGCAAVFRRLPADEPGIDALRRRFRLNGPFILTAGTIEPHKNLARLLEAVARMPAAERAGRPVVLPGNFIGRQRQILDRMASSAGLGRHEFVLTGYLADEDLVRLYNCCEVMVLPSLDEGFGLPALEAMACGAPTIGSRAASIPEIIGRDDALFDPHDIDDMSRLVSRAANDAGFRRTLQAHARERAALFSWDETARRALGAMEATVRARRPAAAAATAAGAPRKRLALVVAGAEGEHFAAALSGRYDVTLVSERPVPRNRKADAIRAGTPEWLRENPAEVDRIVYMLGNTPGHDFMIPLMKTAPGTVILEAFFLGPALARIDGAPDGAWSRALYEGHGFGALRERFRDADAARRKYPANLDLLRRARGVVVRSEAMLTLGRDWLGPALVRDWRLVPEGPDDGERLFAAIEAAHDAGLPGLVEAIVGDGPPLGESEGTALASALARTFPPAGPARRLLLDVSHTAATDLRTGIQRVVRGLVLALLEEPPPGFRVEPVQLARSGGRWRYRHARGFALRLLGCPDDALEDDVAEPAAGDVLFTLDLSGQHLIEADASGLLADLRRRGLSTYAVIYDVLPVLLPHRFPKGTQGGFERWLAATAASDGALCISAAVAGEYRRWVEENAPARRDRLRIGSFHLGADIDGAAPTRGVPEAARDVLAALASRPTFLVVGTIEPRKGHLQAIAAMERLWASGTDANLVVVGAQGWTTLPEDLRSSIPDIVAALRDHREAGRRLFWLEAISDEYLERVYAAASCLLAVSEGEGFGLPLIEAARHGIPILARDLPVFREVAGAHAAYFTGLSAVALADAMAGWLALRRDGRHPRSEGMPWSTWAESARQFGRFLAEAERGAVPMPAASATVVPRGPPTGGERADGLAPAGSG